MLSLQLYRFSSGKSCRTFVTYEQHPDKASYISTKTWSWLPVLANILLQVSTLQILYTKSLSNKIETHWQGKGQPRPAAE